MAINISKPLTLFVTSLQKSIKCPSLSHTMPSKKEGNGPMSIFLFWGRTFFFFLSQIQIASFPRVKARLGD